MNTQAEQVDTEGKTAKKKPDRQVVTIQMEDGTQKEFVGKQRILKDVLIPGIDGYDGLPGVKIAFKNGKIVHYTIPDSLLFHFATHGASQKLGDQAAGYKEDEVDDAYEDIRNLAERLSGPEGWSKEREGGSFAGTSILLQALNLMTGKPVEALREWLKPKSKDEKDAMRRSAQLKPFVEKVEAEMAAKRAHIDTGALFGELDSIASDQAQEAA